MAVFAKRLPCHWASITLRVLREGGLQGGARISDASRFKDLPHPGGVVVGDLQLRIERIIHHPALLGRRAQEWGDGFAHTLVVARVQFTERLL